VTAAIDAVFTTRASSPRALMSYDHHAITLDSLETQLSFHDLTEGEFEIGEIRVIARYLHLRGRWGRFDLSATRSCLIH
jgi:hypothetical protein